MACAQKRAKFGLAQPPWPSLHTIRQYGRSTSSNFIELFDAARHAAPDRSMEHPEKAWVFAVDNDPGLMIRAGPWSKPRGTVLVAGGAHRGPVDGAGGGLGELVAHPSTRQGRLLRRGTSRRRRCSPLMGAPLSANTNDRYWHVST